MLQPAAAALVAQHLSSAITSTSATEALTELVLVLMAHAPSLQPPQLEAAVQGLCDIAQLQLDSSMQGGLASALAAAAAATATSVRGGAGPALPLAATAAAAAHPTPAVEVAREVQAVAVPVSRRAGTSRAAVQQLSDGLAGLTVKDKAAGGAGAAAAAAALDAGAPAAKKRGSRMAAMQKEIATKWVSACLLMCLLACVCMGCGVH